MIDWSLQAFITPSVLAPGLPSRAFDGYVGGPAQGVSVYGLGEDDGNDDDEDEDCRWRATGTEGRRGGGARRGALANPA